MFLTVQRPQLCSLETDTDSAAKDAWAIYNNEYLPAYTKAAANPALAGSTELNTAWQVIDRIYREWLTGGDAARASGNLTWALWAYKQAYSEMSNRLSTLQALATGGVAGQKAELQSQAYEEQQSQEVYNLVEAGTTPVIDALAKAGSIYGIKPGQGVLDNLSAMLGKAGKLALIAGGIYLAVKLLPTIAESAGRYRKARA